MDDKMEDILKDIIEVIMRLLRGYYGCYYEVIMKFNVQDVMEVIMGYC